MISSRRMGLDGKEAITYNTGITAVFTIICMNRR